MAAPIWWWLLSKLVFTHFCDNIVQHINKDKRNRAQRNSAYCLISLFFYRGGESQGDENWPNLQ